MVADKINNRLDHLEKALTENDARINQLQQAVDNLEKYSCRSSVPITDIEKNKDGEEFDKIVTDLYCFNICR